jgi:parvulin-like peptidyl-prolyl isomerase
METRSYRPKKSVRRAEVAAQRPPRPTSHRHLTKHERERRLQRIAIVAAAVVLLAVILIPAYGYWREVIHLGDEALVVVDGQTITTQDYAKYLGTRQAMLTRQIEQAQAAIPTPLPTPTTVATPNPSVTPTTNLTSEQDAAQQTLQTLDSEASSLSTTGLTDLVEAHLILSEAKKRGLTVSQAEMDSALRWVLSPPPPGLQQAFGLEAAPTQLTGSNLLTLDQAKQAMNQIVGKGRYLTATQIDELILKPAVLKGKLLDAFGKDIPTYSDQVHARHILVNTEQEAQAIRQQLESGADFATLAKEKSIDPGTKDKGGDLGWFGKGVMAPEFEKAAFSLKVGEISQPVKTQFGYHIIQVLARDPHHPLDTQQLEQAKEQAYQSWLGKQESDSKLVSYQLSTQKMSWVRSYIQTGN